MFFFFSFSQYIIIELDQNLRANVEQVINTGKRLYSTDNKDSSGVESAGMYQGNAEREKEREREVVLYPSLFYLCIMICYDNQPVEKKIFLSY